MIKISSLYSLENVQDFYELDENTLEVWNTKTGTIKTVNINKRGYPIVFLQKKGGGHCINVPMHKIVALALINNGPYRLIEHLDDNKLDYRPENLAFSNQSNNGFHAFDNGKHVVIARTFAVLLENGKEYSGTMRKISNDSGVPLGALYDNFLYGIPQNSFRAKGVAPRVVSITETGQQTIKTRKSRRVE